MLDAKPCKNGHISERNKYGKCRECLRLASNRYHWKHREDRLKVHSEYGKTSQKVKERRKKYNKENKEKRNLYSSQWHELNKDKASEYRKERKDIYATHARNRRKKVDEKHSIDDVLNILEKQNYKCIYCQASLKKKYHIDHVIPLFLGGSNKKHNLQALCPPCNLSKNKKHPIDFAQEKGLLL